MNNFKKSYEKYLYYCDVMKNTPSNLYIQFNNTMNIILLLINLVFFIPMVVSLMLKSEHSTASQIMPIFTFCFMIFIAKSLFKKTNKDHLKFYFYNSSNAIEEMKQSIYKDKELVKSIFKAMVQLQYKDGIIRDFMDEVESNSLTDDNLEVAYNVLYPMVKKQETPVSLYDSLMSEHQMENNSQKNIQFFNGAK